MSLVYPGRNLTKPEWGEIHDPSELAEAQVRVCHLRLFLLEINFFNSLLHGLIS
jgi:hypothetical protein